MFDIEAKTAPADMIGVQLEHGGGYGVVTSVKAAAPGGFVIGAGLSPVRTEYEVAWESGRVSTLADGIAAPMIARAAHRPRVPLADIPARLAAARKAQAEAVDAAAQERDAAQERAAAFRIEAAAKTPADAKAVLVAELIEDRSDTMTDYHGSTTTRTVILGFSTHTRDLFSEMRNAARNFAETADLADAPESAEHREKYSMGAGYYLKKGWRDSNGWKVSKKRLWNGSDSIPVGEWALTAPAAPAPVQGVSSAAVGSVTISEHTHEKKGFTMWIAAISERVERDEYARLLSLAKARGGWYSRKWGSSPAGFAFKVQANAEAFAAEIGGGEAPAAGPVSAPKPAAPAPGVADKLRDMADRLQRDIDAKNGPRLTNTPKRQREAATARHEGDRLQRVQQAARALADHHEAGTVPAALRGVTTKAALYDLARSHIDTRNAGYYDAGIDTGRPAKETPQTLAFWDLLRPPSDAERTAATLRDKIEKLRFANLAGYFPTPPELVARMIEAAGLPSHGAAAVLEPEAGSGAICDAVREHNPDASLTLFEVSPQLADVLKAKGYTLAGSDFLDALADPFADFVLMNPPFEKGQDMAHVRHAFDFLKPGGRLVAIMSPGPFFRSDAKAEAFRAWFDDLAGERVDIPAGAFKSSGTDVATVLVTIDKAEG